MKKIIFLISLLTLLVGMAFAQTPPRPYYQQIMLDATHIGEITDYITNTGTTHNVDYLYSVTVDGVTFTTETAPVSVMRVFQLSGVAMAFVNQSLWPSVWTIGATIECSLTYIPTNETATHSIIVPEGSALINMNGANAWVGIPPFPTTAEDFSLGINSNWTGAAIYLDGIDRKSVV